MRNDDVENRYNIGNLDGVAGNQIIHLSGLANEKKARKSFD